jgi:large subunit ribosomal protein L30e
MLKKRTKKKGTGKRMSMDIPKEIRRAVDTGTVSFGYRNAEKNILKGKGEIVIISRNCPQRLSERIRHYSQIAGIPFFEFEGSALELGSICGKPFMVSTLLVLDKGKSKVLDLSSMTIQPRASGKPTKRKKPVSRKKAPKKKAKKTGKKSNAPKTRKRHAKKSR